MCFTKLSIFRKTFGSRICIDIFQFAIHIYFFGLPMIQMNSRFEWMWLGHNLKMASITPSAVLETKSSSPASKICFTVPHSTRYMMSCLSLLAKECYLDKFIFLGLFVRSDCLLPCGILLGSLQSGHGAFHANWENFIFAVLIQTYDCHFFSFAACYSI